MYLYCTKPKVKWRVGSLGFFDDELYRLPSGEIKYGSSVELMACDNYTKDNFLSGKVVARFWFDDYIKLDYEDTYPMNFIGEILIISGKELEKATCLSQFL